MGRIASDAIARSLLTNIRKWLAGTPKVTAASANQTATQEPMRPAGEILPSSIITQTFAASSDYLSGVSILLGTFDRTNYCSVTFRILRAAGTHIDCVRQTTISAQDIYNNRTYEFFFDPIPESIGKQYVLSIESEDSSPGNAITIWTEIGYGKDLGLQQAHIATNERGVVKDYSLRIVPRYSPPLADTIIPRGLLLSPVTQCNFNCIHCISRSTRTRRSILPRSIADSIKVYAKEGLIERIAADYSGDLLFADHKYGGWLDFVVQLQKPFHLTTHGGHLTQDRIQKLISSQLDSICISVDAATEETFRRIRRGPFLLEEVLENAALFVQAAHAAQRHDISVALGFTIMKSNIHELPMLMQRAREIGIHAIQARHVEAYFDNIVEESMVHHKELYNCWREEVLELASAQGVAVAMPDAFAMRRTVTGHLYCREPWYSAVLLGNGDVMACCIPGTKMGNVLEQPLEEIWNGPRYQALRSRINTPHAPSICMACPILRLPDNEKSYIKNRDGQDSEDWIWR